MRPLTLRQVQEIEPILMASAVETKGNVAAAMAIVSIALARDHAEAAASLGDIEATAPRDRRRHGGRFSNLVVISRSLSQETPFWGKVERGAAPVYPRPASIFDFCLCEADDRLRLYPAEIDEMAMHDVRSLFGYWRDYPAGA